MLDLNKHFNFYLIANALWSTSKEDDEQLSRDLLKLYKGQEVVLRLGKPSGLSDAVEHLESLGYFCVRIGGNLIVSKSNTTTEKK